MLKNTKKPEGGPFGTLKNVRKKVAQGRKKIKRGDPLVSAGFVGYVKKVRNERRETEKYSRKSRSAEKNSKGGTL